MDRRLIGTGITDENGRCTVSYTGNGTGKVQLTAEHEGVFSEIYEVYDVLFKDTSTSDFVLQEGASITESDNIYSLSASKDTWIWCNLKGTSAQATVGDYTGDLIYEMDVTSVTGTSQVVVYYTFNSTNKNNYKFTPLIGHNKLVIHPNMTISHYVDDVLIQTVTSDLTEYYRLGFHLRTNDQVSFKNVRIYPI